MRQTLVLLRAKKLISQQLIYRIRAKQVYNQLIWEAHLRLWQYILRTAFPHLIILANAL